MTAHYLDSISRFSCLALLAFTLGACNQNSVTPSQSLSPKQVAAIAESIDQRYPKQSDSERRALLQQVVTAIDNMVFVKGGTFEMGDFGWSDDFNPPNMCEWPCGVPRDELQFLEPDYDSDSRPLHTVRLDGFYMAKYHTTVGEDDRFRRFAGLPIEGEKGRALAREVGTDVAFRTWVSKRFAPDLPAYSPVWQKAKDYCLWLGELSALPVDLPTEAQYEYAARSGGRYVVYATDTGSLNAGRNFDRGPDKHPVGAYPPNPLGLYEMVGNATSWVNDWYAADYYENSPVDNPQGPENGMDKVQRGGYSMTMRRSYSEPMPDGDYTNNSFRCAIQQSGPLK